MKKTIATVLFVSLTTLTFAQKNKVVNCYNYMKSEEYDKAIENIDQAIEHSKTKDDAKTWKYRGDAYLGAAASEEHKDVAESPLLVAFESYYKAIELDEKDRYKQEIIMNMVGVMHPMGLNIGVDKFQAQKYESAMEHFGVSAAIKGMTGEMDTLALYNTALAAERAEKLDEALEIYTQVARSGYNDGDVYSLAAGIYRQKGDPKGMIQMIKEGREKHPDNAGLIIDELNFYLINEQYDEAKINLDIAIEKDPENPILYFSKGTVMEGLEDKDGAEEAYKKAIELDPDYFDPTYNLGALYFNTAVEYLDEIQEIKDVKKYNEEKKVADQYFEDALPYLERAHELNPEDRATMASLVELYARTNASEKWEKMRAKLKGE